MLSNFVISKRSICIPYFLSRDGPLLVVASGRDTIPVSSAIKQLAPENVFLVQVKVQSPLERDAYDNMTGNYLMLIKKSEALHQFNHLLLFSFTD